MGKGNCWGIFSPCPSVQPSSAPTGQLLSATAHHCWLLGRAVTSSVPGHYRWIRTARPNVLSWPCSAGCCYRCLTATAQISSSGRQKVHPVQDTAPGSVQATRVFPLVKTGSELLSFNWVLSDSSSMCAGTFGVRERTGMLQRADARVPSSVLGVYSSTLVLCEFPSSPAKLLI